MRRSFWLFLLLLLAFSASLTFAQDDPAGETYVIEEGDTLISIALQFEKPILCLQLANDLTTFAPVLGGKEELFIPGDCAAVEGQGGGVVIGEDQQYTVQRGDRLGRIANQFNRPLSCLVQANNIANPDLIYPGQVLLIPGDCSTVGLGGGTAPIAPATTTTVTGTTVNACRFDGNAGRQVVNGVYTIQAGDTLDFIACEFNVELSCLIASNPQLGANRLILPGDLLTINRACPPWQDSTTIRP